MYDETSSSTDINVPVGAIIIIMEITQRETE